MLRSAFATGSRRLKPTYVERRPWLLSGVSFQAKSGACLSRKRKRAVPHGESNEKNLQQQTFLSPFECQPVKNLQLATGISPKGVPHDNPTAAFRDNPLTQESEYTDNSGLFCRWKWESENTGNFFYIGYDHALYQSFPLAVTLQARRWMSTNNGNKVTRNDPKKDDKLSETGEDGGTSESLDPRAFLLGTRESLRKVTEVKIGDMLATYAIVLLLAIILISPVVGSYMRGSESTYDELDTDDQVVDLARIIKKDFLEKVSEDGTLEDKGVVDSVLADVLSSRSLQDQAIKFVVTILQSDEMKAACQKLLKDLWEDLVKDPETTAQVIYLLNVAIQNEDIRLAVKKLVLDIVEDEEVMEELVRLLQKLGKDQEVLDATKVLLTESAHNALNDPEILDHSMEFATDVVGDDVVQRTAGEALRNTLSYAVKPGATILLAATGVGLLIFSVMSLGYARSSEHDARVLDEAVDSLARSLQPSPRLLDKVWHIIALPFKALASAANGFFTTVLLPFKAVQYVVARLEYTGSAAKRAVQVTTSWLAATTMASCSRSTDAISNLSSFVWVVASWVGTAVVGSATGVLVAANSFLCSMGKVGNGFASGVTSTFDVVSSLFRWFGRSTGAAIGRVGSFFAHVRENVKLQGLPRVWILLDTLSTILCSSRAWLASFAVFVTGSTGTKS